MAKKIIALDCGHGLNTAGKQTPDGIKEWLLNDKVRDKVVAYLEPYDCKIIHTDNDEGNTDESLADRLNRYLQAKAEAFVSIHHNAFTGDWNSATGVEVYTDNNPTKEDLRLADCIYGRLVNNTKLKGRGIKKAAWKVINQNSIPAVLCEGGFMDGEKDYKYITSDEGQTAYAKAVAEGLIEFLSLEKKASPKKSNEKIAQEVLKGLWGNGQDRINRLTAAGYDYYAIQNIVNGTKKTTSAPKVNYFTKYTGTSASIVSALKSIGVTSSFAYRTKIAKANGIKLYAGTAKQNTTMLNLLKQGKLIKP
jgi:N-acetylmuramoyl-L-alanine amidase